MQLRGRLISQYQLMHQRGFYPGGSTLKRHVAAISRIVAEIPTTSILDYGCGKGKQYTQDRLHDAWGVMPMLFDPAVPGIDELPEGTFDGVICSGVLEHIPRKELPMAVGNLARYARKWCFVSVGCVLAHKQLPNGLNAHVTIEPEEWWQEMVGSAFGDDVRVELEFIWA